jgi:hypothetical protein
MDPKVDSGSTLILCHKNLHQPKISDKPLVDDVIIEVSWEGKITWEWTCSDHFDEMGFSEEAKNTLARNPGLLMSGVKLGDWMHMNSISTLGPNKWYDGGDKRFHPDNIIWDGRETNITAITDKRTGKIVWQVGPDFSISEALRKMEWIIGQHHAHMIPRGLPGEGNILVFDNGGWAGYGSPNPGAPTGNRNARRDFSRIIEYDPITLEVVWQYPPRDRRGPGGGGFYSSFMSSAQRLPNGNTLITEGADGRLFEVTPEHEVVWEYMSPYAFRGREGRQIYRAYRVPYEWAPQAERPKEKAVGPLDNGKFRVPGAAIKRPQKVTKVKW